MMDDTVITLDKEHGNNQGSPAWAAEIGRLAAKLSETKDHLATSIGTARVESYSKFCELWTEVVQLTKELRELSAEYEKTKWKVKFTAGMLSLVFGVAGYLGFRYGYREFYRDVKDTVTRKLETEIQSGILSADRTFYNDLVAGNALNAAGRYAQATARLMGCFREGHYNDPTVLLPLLDSIYKNDDEEAAKTVLDVLENEKPPLGEINDHTILAYIGSIEVQAGEFQPDWTAKGFSLLQRAQLLAPASDAATLGLIHTNYWLYYVQEQDWKSAEAEISALKQLDLSLDTWDTLRRRRFFVGYFGQTGNSQFEPRIRAMWAELRQRAATQ